MKTMSEYGLCPTLHRLVICSLKVPLQHIFYIHPLFMPLISGITVIECVHITSRQPCWRSKRRNHVGGVKYSFGDETLFLCNFLLLFHYANMATDHMSEHTLSFTTSQPVLYPILLSNSELSNSSNCGWFDQLQSYICIYQTSV